MPFYEYQCAQCGQHHEELQKVSDKPLRKCPACGRSALKRMISAPVFRLKGGGWYETDFKNDKDSQRNLAGDKEPVAEPAAEKKADAAKDSKDTVASTDKPAAVEKKPEAPKKATSKPARKPAATRRGKARSKK